MHKKILLSVDNSRPARAALAYAISMSSTIPDLNYMLLYVQPMVSQYLKEEARTMASARKQLEKIAARNAKFANEILNEYRKEMVAKGIDGNRIETQTKPRKLGIAKDVIDTAQQHQYDAIVVGRRGLSGIAKLYAGSVTTDILEQSQVIPVWLVDGNVTPGNILLAVDGSEASLRMVDHVSFILSGNTTTWITLLHVTNGAQNYCEIDLSEINEPSFEDIVVRGDKACIDDFYPLAMQKFKDAGLDEGRIRYESVSGHRRIGKVIVEFAGKGNFSTMVVGRRGIDKSFFMGSVSRHLINKLDEGALWVVP
jgi:nucleotide-binding universal stress UspA family protein